MNYKPVQVNKDKWFSLSIAEQLGNTGSELDRYVNLLKRNDLENSEIAFYRAIDLLDLTKQNPTITRAQRKEVAKVKEVLCDSIVNAAQNYNTPIEYFQKYFMDFALVARKQHLERRSA